MLDPKVKRAMELALKELEQMHAHYIADGCKRTSDACPTMEAILALEDALKP